MTYKDRYNKISKHIFMLALLPQSPYLFKYTCKLLARGVMRASQEPVDLNLTEWPWFKAGIAILKQPMFDESNVSSPDELNVSEWAKTQIVDGFKQLEKSLRWHVQRQEQHFWRTRDEEDVPPPPIDMETNSGYAILKNIVYAIDGGYLGPEGKKIGPSPREALLLYDNQDVGILEFRPWALKDLYEDCDKKLNLSLVPWGTLLDQRTMFRNWYDNYLEEATLGEDDFESYLTMLETHLPDVSEDHWFKGYNRAGGKIPPPPPPPPRKSVAETEVKQENTKGIRFETRENTPEGYTTYHDLILDAQYVISNRTRAKKVIESMLVDLRNGVKQWRNDWKSHKGAFVRDDASRFKDDQVEHQLRPSFNGGTTEQFTGMWRIRTDEEVSDWMKNRVADKTTAQTE